MSPIPTASRVFFQPLSVHLAYPGFNEQCEQQNNWHHKQDQKYNWHSQPAAQRVEEPEAPQKKSRQEMKRVEEPEDPPPGGSRWPLHSMCTM